MSYVEVYKEDLRDLLELETNVKDIHIREDEKGNTGADSAIAYECIIIWIISKLYYRAPSSHNITCSNDSRVISSEVPKMLI